MVSSAKGSRKPFLLNLEDQFTFYSSCKFFHVGVVALQVEVYTQALAAQRFFEKRCRDLSVILHAA